MNKMNVTSLLNTGAAAVGRLANAQAGAPLEDTPMNMYHQDQNTSQTTGDQLRLPVRSSRTPWNADGYSLPNLTHNLKDNNLQQQHRPFDSDSTPTAYSDAAAADPMTSPKSSPKHHKFSDSRGSMSSTYSTTNMSLSSAASCHSRISSLSTVSEYQPLSLNGGGIYGSSDCGTERRLSASCPTVVEPPRGENDEEDGNEGGGEDEGMGSEDCGRSPSDAVMMRNRLSGSASPSDLKHSNYLHPDSPSSISTRAHKRTVSAPAFPSLNNLNRTSRYSSFGPMAEPTPPKSPTLGDSHTTSINEDTNGEDGGEMAIQQQPPVPEEPVCLYMTNCTTGSSPRKMVSHIFGRNKLCTKSIPTNIWVHYCRKHYQRTRYRNVHDFAMIQVDLVREQMKRVQSWSDDNVKYNRSGNGVLRHWTLQARKREAKRLQDNESRKRRYAEEDPEMDDDNSGTAIPSWLQSALNENYATPRMLEIIQEIKDHMTAGDIAQIPDIEILPDIITDGNETRPKPATRRTSSSGGHRHTKSEAFRPQSSFGTPRYGGVDAKRMRSGASPFNYPMPALTQRPGQPMNMNQNYQYTNSGFGAIAESQADHGYWGGASYNPSSVLPNPVPQLSQRSQDTTAMQQPYVSQGRPSMHARSMSEVPAMRNTGYPPTEFRFPPQSVSYGAPQQQPQDMYSNMAMSPQQHYGYQPQAPQGLYNMSPRADNQDGVYNSFYQPQQEWPVSRGQHARVQSTPSVHQHGGSIPGGPPSMSGSQGLPSMHQHHMGGHQQGIYATGQPGYNDFQQGRF